MINYKSAGVDIQTAHETISRFKKNVESTFSSAVLTDIGSFGALYDLKSIVNDYEHPVLVQSIDGVGTKTIIARMMNQFDTIGIDLVSAVTNDIIVLGARPLTFLDYIANDKLNPAIVEQLMDGMVKACRENAISLVGGETAQMPDTYLPGEHDLVGVVTGVVEKDRAILGKTIVPGDKVYGFASSGLHTNGYSLARKLMFDIGGFTINTVLPELQRTVGEALLEPHINYTRPILHLLKNNVPIKGMAHITGGGLLGNVPRILPNGCSIEISPKKWPEQGLFSVLRQLGQLDDQECFTTFNMGIGLVLVGTAAMGELAKAQLQDFPEFKLYEIGHVTEGHKEIKLIK